jgi:hypothetical protein
MNPAFAACRTSSPTSRRRCWPPRTTSATCWRCART